MENCSLSITPDSLLMRPNTSPTNRLRGNFFIAFTQVHYLFKEIKQPSLLQLRAIQAPQYLLKVPPTAAIGSLVSFLVVIGSITGALPHRFSRYSLHSQI